MEKENFNRNFGFLTLDAARLLQDEFNRRVRPLGLTRSQIRVLTSIYRTPGISQSQLTNILDVQKAALGRMIDRLTEKGWVERRQDENDRRVNRLHLTKEVEPLIRTTRTIAADVRKLGLNGINRDDQNKFIDILTKIKTNLNKFQIEKIK